MIQVVTETVDGTRWELDVDQREAIALTKTFLSLTDIEQRSGDFTRQFSLPRSQRNDWFFGQFGDPSAIGYYWNASIEAPVWLLDNTNLIIEGSLRMESSDPKHGRYNVSISGRIFTIKELLGETLMSDLDMTAWTFTPSQIATTWGRTIFGGHMVFPIHDFGFGFGLYSKKSGAVTLYDISNVATPIVLDQMIPAFRLNELIRMMFNSRGITVQGSWFSESEVEEIYVQANNPRSSFITLIGTMQATLSSTQTLTTTPTTIRYFANPADPNWSNTLYEYTAPQSGTYFWDLVVTPTPGTPTTNIMLIQPQINGVNFGAPYVGNWSSQRVITNMAIPLTAGNTFRVQIYVNSAPTTNGYLYTYNTNTLKLVNTVLTGISVNPSEFWTNIRQVDFLKAILSNFNIIIWQDKDQKINIDTWTYYMANYGTKKDWTSKVDLNSLPMVKPINNELRNPINLELTRTNDILNKEYFEVAGRQYGSYREDTRIPFTQDMPPAIPTLSPGPVQSIISNVASAAYSDILISKFYESEEDVSFSQPELILYYYNGERSSGKNYRTVDASGGAQTIRTVYPFFSNFRLFLASGWQVLQSTLDLNFTFWTPPDPGIVTAPSEFGLYNRYFREMLRERYDLANKVIEFKAVLNSYDIENFNFADTIIINLKGTPVGLKILEIRDYVVGKPRAVSIKAMITFIE